MKRKWLALALLAATGAVNAEDPPASRLDDEPASRPADKAAGNRLFERGMVDVDQPMTITSDRFEFDYRQKVAIFDGSVKVAHPQFYLEANQVFVFLEGEGEQVKELKNILAQGGVVMTNENNSATCAWALYTRAEGTLVMRGGAEGGDAQLIRGTDVAAGPEILLELENDRMTIEGGASFTISPETMKSSKNAVEAKPGADEPEPVEKPRDKPAPGGPSLYKDPEAAE